METLGGLVVPYRETTGNQTITSTDVVVVNTGPAATWTINTTGLVAGQTFTFINHGTGTLTIPVTRTSSGTTVNTLANNATGMIVVVWSGSQFRRVSN